MEIEGFEFPDDFYYEKYGSYLWAKLEDGKARIGVADFGLALAGDIVYLEVPAEGDEVKQEEAFGVAETVKATAELISPLSGEVVEVNAEATEDPNVLREKNWFIVIKPSNLEEELANLMKIEEAKEYFTKEIKKAKEEGLLG
jgi:glycine cleavage system H protein